MEILFGHFRMARVHITKIELRCTIRSCLSRMNQCNPSSLIEIKHSIEFLSGMSIEHPFGWMAKEFTGPWCRCREYQTRHEPCGWNFTQKYQENCSQLPFTEITIHFSNDIDFFHFIGHAIVVGQRFYCVWICNGWIAVDRFYNNCCSAWMVFELRRTLNRLYCGWIRIDL